MTLIAGTTYRRRPALGNAQSSSRRRLRAVMEPYAPGSFPSCAECSRSVSHHFRSNSSLAAMTSASSKPVHPFFPEPYWRTISASLLVASSSSFFTEAKLGGGTSSSSVLRFALELDESDSSGMSFSATSFRP